MPPLAYGLSTYFLLIIGAGHLTKMWALVYAPPMMGGIWMTLRGGRPGWGGALTALFASLEIGANHPQITYYFLLAAALFWLSEGIVALREKLLKPFAKRTAVLAAAGLLALGSNFAPLWYTAQHAKDAVCSRIVFYFDNLHLECSVSVTMFYGEGGFTLAVHAVNRIGIYAR